MDGKKYGLVREKGLIQGTRFGHIDRVDGLYATLLYKLLKEILQDLNIKLNIDEVNSLSEKVEVKENVNNGETYRNYYINNKKVMCIKNRNTIIGEVKMNDAMAFVVMDILEKDVLANKKPQNNNVKEDSKEHAQAKESNKKPMLRKQRKPAFEPKNGFEDETKQILSTISKEDMESKGFSYMTEEEYKKRDIFK